MGITVIPNLLNDKVVHARAAPKKISDLAQEGKYYRHPDSIYISYPLVVEKPLGSINKPLNIAIVGAGPAGIAALYELSILESSANNIRFTIYESDPDSFVNQPLTHGVRTKGLKAGRVSAAISNGEPVGDHAVYEIGAMRFPEIAGLMWHYAAILYNDNPEVGVFPNPGTVPTEFVHGNRVDRFSPGTWLDKNSPTKLVLDIVRNGLFGVPDAGVNESLFLIGGQDPAKVSAKLKNKETTDGELAAINESWKAFVNKYDKLTLASAISEIIEAKLDKLPNVVGITTIKDKINYYVELFGTVGFGTGGFKSVYNMGLLEMMRLLLWNYSNEYLLPVTSNVQFIEKLYLQALSKNPNVVVKQARVNDVYHLDGNSKGSTLVVYYDVIDDETEGAEVKTDEFDFVILATTPRQTSAMISKIGYENVGRRVSLGDYKRPLLPEKYIGNVRPALILSNTSEAANTKVHSAINHIHMTSCSKIFVTVKKSEFDDHAPEFKNEGKIRAILSDFNLGSSYVVPSTIPAGTNPDKYKDYYSFLISYAWEDDSKRLQHHFRNYPLNIDDTQLMMNAIINRTTRYVRDPLDQLVKSWWFGEALSKGKLEDPLSYDWTTFNSNGAFKLDNAGDHYNSNLLFRYHTHALKPELKNKFFIANCSYGHLGGWIEGAFMSAVNAVCGLIVAANGGDVNVLSAEARKVVESFDNVVDK